MDSQPPFTREELLRIASSQKAIITLILVNFLFAIGLVSSLISLGPEHWAAGVIVSAVRWVLILLNLVAVVVMYRLAKALHRTAWVYALAAFFPCVGLITLLVINHFATRALRRHGVRVGLTGAVESYLEALPLRVTPPSSDGPAQSSNQPEWLGSNPLPDCAGRVFVAGALMV
jgi:hypothetical protein